MKKVFSFLFIVICIQTITLAQQQESYTFCTGSSSAYLIDTSATSTSSAFKTFSIGSTSYTAHFQKDTIYQSSGMSATPGGYTSVKKWAWNGTSVSSVWTYAISGAHHDICPMPNGNVLVIVDESKTGTNVTAAGGSSSTAVKSTIIREIKPTGATTGTVVWEWKLWDHLCQSTNSGVTSTYVTNIAEHPERFNINCTQNGGLTSDWFHMNGIDYNPTLDQIVLSSHIKNEVYIIDHSTTTAQAATHTGGNAGKGGDFLFRWGSPENYGCTANGNGISVNVIHDARWVPATNSVWPNYISVFHNNTGTGNAQAVLFLPTYSTTVPFTYTYTPGSVVGPTTCIKPTVKSFTVQNMGGCQALDNGNILITNPGTTFYECRNSATALQSISTNTTQSDRLKKTDVFGPWLATNAASNTICTNATATLNCVVTTAPSITNPTYTYSWTSVPAGFTSTLQNPTITPTAAGTYVYTVVVSMTGTCSTTSISTTNTASITITVNSATTPTITQNGSLLTSSSANAYQWYFNGTLIPSETNQTYTPTQSGAYRVLITDANGCTAASAPFDFTVTGISENENIESLQVYPNPTTGMVNIEGVITESNEFEIIIFDICGKIQYQNKNVKNVDISDLQNGMYYVTVVSGKKKTNKKITLIK